MKILIILFIFIQINVDCKIIADKYQQIIDDKNSTIDDRFKKTENITRNPIKFTNKSTFKKVQKNSPDYYSNYTDYDYKTNIPREYQITQLPNNKAKTLTQLLRVVDPKYFQSLLNRPITTTESTPFEWTDYGPILPPIITRPIPLPPRIYRPSPPPLPPPAPPPSLPPSITSGLSSPPATCCPPACSGEASASMILNNLRRIRRQFSKYRRRQCTPICAPHCLPRCIYAVKFHRRRLLSRPRPPALSPLSSPFQPSPTAIHTICRPDCMPDCSNVCLQSPSPYHRCIQRRCRCMAGYTRCGPTTCCLRYRNMAKKFHDTSHKSSSSTNNQVDDDLYNTYSNDENSGRSIRALNDTQINSYDNEEEIERLFDEWTMQADEYSINTNDHVSSSKLTDTDNDRIQLNDDDDDYVMNQEYY